jgi:hypothetical protein
MRKIPNSMFFDTEDGEQEESIFDPDNTLRWIVNFTIHLFKKYVHTNKLLKFRI